MKIVELKPRESSNKNEIIKGLEDLLREARAGHLEKYIALAVVDDNFIIHWSSDISPLEGIAYSAILQDSAMNRMRD